MPKYDVAIVGGSGFIGSSLAMHLSKIFKVKVIDQKPPPETLEGKVDFSLCDIRRYGELKKSLKNVQLAIHTAIIQIPLINEMKRLGYEVNILGVQNMCQAVEDSEDLKGLILAGSWHVVGERELRGVINEEFGFRPDKIEERARLYALSKIAQETIVRMYDETSSKVYGVIRMGTVLGENMPKETAANLFITKAIKGEPITPYSHSMHRPMLYVDIKDVCKGFQTYAKKILNGEVSKDEGSLGHIINLVWPKPVTIIELAHTVKDAVMKYSRNRIKPEIRIVQTGKPNLYSPKDKERLRVDLTRAKEFLKINRLIKPKESIARIIKERMDVSRPLEPGVEPRLILKAQQYGLHIA